MRFKQVFLTALIAAVTAMLSVWLVGKPGQGNTESTYDRVMRTGVLRCGYYMFKPMSWRDPQTNELRGMVVDVAEAIEKRSGIKLEWTEEVTFGSMYEGLKTQRYDAICTPSWPDGSAARVADFGRTWFFSAIIPVVKSDENHLTSVAQLDSPNVTITTHDGDADDELARVRFPQAKILALPQGTDTSAMEANLFSGKADVILSDVNRIYQFNATNTKKLKALSMEPLQLFPMQMVVNRGDEQLNRFLDTNIESLLNDGTMTQIVLKYQPAPNAYLLLAKPYEVTR